MRILVYTTLFPNSVNPQHGIFVETRLRELVARHDIDARVVAPVPWFPSPNPRFGQYAAFARVPAREERHGLTVEHPNYLVLPKVGMHIAPRLLALGSAAAIRHVRQSGFDFDFIDAHYLYPDGVAAARIARRLDRPLVLTARGSDVNVIGHYPSALARMLAAADVAQAIIAVSSALRTKMISLGFDERKIVVLRNGVDMSRFVLPAGEPDRFGLPSELRLIGFVGNLVPVKGVDLILEALREMPGAGLVVAGDGALRTALQRKAQELGVAERTRFLGRLAQPDLVRLYGAIECLLLASHSEGWPNVLLEAMACGTPVAVVPIPGMEEIVAGPVAGAIALRRQPAALANAVREVLGRGLPRASVRRYAAGYSWEATAAGLNELFTRIVK